MASKKTFDDWLVEVDARLRPLAIALRRMFLEAAPDFRESIKWGKPCFEKKVKIFYIASQADKYVTVGLWQGALLPNPDGLIEGTGKRMRHVKVRSVEEMAPSRLGPIIRGALELDGARGRATARGCTYGEGTQPDTTPGFLPPQE